MGFKTYYENDIFGFEDIEAKKAQDALTPEGEPDDLPIRPFSVQWMMDVLARQKVGGRIKSTHFFLDEVIWGEPKGIGSVRVKITPNIRVYIERQIEDMLGQRTWINKAVFKPDLTKYAGNEEQVAYDIFDEVQKIYFTNVERASETYDNLTNLVRRMAGRVRSQAPEIYSYQDTKEVNRDYYIIYFAIRNVGVGKLVNKRAHVTRTPEATIDVNYNRERGLIRVILSTVSVGSGTGQGAWEVDLPYLDSWYAPGQNKDEIIDTVLTALKYY